jgi:4-hydroxyphenylpyruvate dioxygenase
MNPLDRESIPEAPNRLGLEGIEFIEYVTPQPQALGQVLEKMGFRPVARHRSREVVLYRQGDMNLIVNAHPDDARLSQVRGAQPVIAAVAFRVQDALRAHTRCIELGAWDAPSHARAMELHIPAIQGTAGTKFYFVDRWKEFSIYDVDFVPIPSVDQRPPALGDMRYFGVVQYIGTDRGADWGAFYERMFGFLPIPDDQRYGILPKGHLWKSPCGQFLWQLIEVDPLVEEGDDTERLQRIGLGCQDVLSTVKLLKTRGVEFVDSSILHPEDRGALTRTVLGQVAFELVAQS